MDALTDLTITVKVDTSLAKQEVDEFRNYALRVLDEVRAAYAAAGQAMAGTGMDQGIDGGLF